MHFLYPEAMAIGRELDVEGVVRIELTVRGGLCRQWFRV